MGNMRYLILMWGAAMILVIMGIHALRSDKPVTLWTGSLAGSGDGCQGI